MVVASAWANLRIKTRHGFEVVVVDIGLGIDHNFDSIVFSQEIWCEHFDGGIQCHLANCGDYSGEVPCPAVVEVISIDRSDDDMAKLEPGYGLGYECRLVRILRIWYPGSDVAECTRARTHRAQNHHCRMSFGPTFTNVGARGFFAYRD